VPINQPITEFNPAFNRFPVTLAFDAQLPSTITVNTTVVMKVARPINAYSIYVLTLELASVVAATHDANSYWKLEFFRRDTSTNTSLGSVNSFQTGRVAGTRYTDTITVGALHSPTDALVYFLSATKAGATATPGALTLDPAVMWFKLAGI